MIDTGNMQHNDDNDSQLQQAPKINDVYVKDSHTVHARTNIMTSLGKILPILKSPQKPKLETRTNIMPGLDRLLPFLDAFGNIGQSGHKEGGKAPVPAK